MFYLGAHVRFQISAHATTQFKGGILAQDTGNPHFNHQTCFRLSQGRSKSMYHFPDLPRVRYPPLRYGAMYSNGARKTNSIDGQKIVGEFSKVLVLLVTRRQQTRAGIQVHGVSSRPTSDCMHDRLRPSSICSKTPLVESFMFRVVLHNPNDTDEEAYAAIHNVHRRRFTRPLGDGVYETAQRGRRSKSNH